MSENPGKRKPRKISRDEQMIAALVQHGSAGKAAEALGISRTTVWRRLQNPVFEAAYEAAKKEQRQELMSRFPAALPLAIATLAQIMRQESAPAASRVAAARIVVETTQEHWQAESVETRVEKLEYAVRQRNEAPPACG